jgi:hypothetical protein
MAYTSILIFARFSAIALFNASLINVSYTLKFQSRFGFNHGFMQLGM